MLPRVIKPVWRDRVTDTEPNGYLPTVCQTGLDSEGLVLPVTATVTVNYQQASFPVAANIRTPTKRSNMASVYIK